MSDNTQGGGPKKIHLDLDEAKKEFFENAKEYLQTAEDGILRIESESGNPDLVDELFRAIHSLKGEAALLQMKRMKVLSHAMEDLLNVLRKGSCRFTPDMGDALFQALDGLGKLLHVAESGKGEEPDTSLLENQLRNLATTAVSAAPPSGSAVFDGEGDDEAAEGYETTEVAVKAPTAAQLEENAELQAEQNEYLLILVDGVRYGLPVMSVLGINRMLKAFYLPFIEDYILGIANLRGEILPLLDLRRRLALPDSQSEDRRIVVAEHENRRVGLIADSIIGIHPIEASAMTPSRQTLAGATVELVKATARLSQGIVQILEVERLFERCQESQLSVLST